MVTSNECFLVFLGKIGAKKCFGPTDQSFGIFWWFFGYQPTSIFFWIPIAIIQFIKFPHLSCSFLPKIELFFFAKKVDQSWIAIPNAITIRMEPYKFYGFSTPQALKNVWCFGSEWGKKDQKSHRFCPSGAFPRDLPNCDSPMKTARCSWIFHGLWRTCYPMLSPDPSGATKWQLLTSTSKSLVKNLVTKIWVSNKHQKKLVDDWDIGLTINSNQHHKKKGFLSTTEVIIWEVIKPLCHEIMTDYPDRSFKQFYVIVLSISIINI